MRFTEIANPEDQLALWRMVSDSMWKVFGQPSPTTQPNNTQHAQPNPINALKPIATPRPTVEPLAKWLTSTILSAGRQLCWPVETGNDLYGLLLG